MKIACSESSAVARSRTSRSIASINQSGEPGSAANFTSSPVIAAVGDLELVDGDVEVSVVVALCCVADRQHCRRRTACRSPAGSTHSRRRGRRCVSCSCPTSCVSGPAAFQHYPPTPSRSPGHKVSVRSPTVGHSGPVALLAGEHRGARWVTMTSFRSRSPTAGCSAATTAGFVVPIALDATLPLFTLLMLGVAVRRRSPGGVGGSHRARRSRSSPNSSRRPLLRPC